MDNSFKQGDLQPKSFAEVIDRAILRDETNRVSLAAKWGSTPESLYRWQNNKQSPKLHDLVRIVKRMNNSERADVACVLFGPAADAESKEVANKAKQALLDRIVGSAEELRKLLAN